MAGISTIPDDVQWCARTCEQNSVRFPLLLLHCVSHLSCPVQKACCILAYGDVDDVIESISLVTPDEYRELVDERLAALATQAQSSANTFVMTDIWKLVRVAYEEYSWREFCVWSSIQSVVGSKNYCRITNDTIRLRASGFVKLDEKPDGVGLLTPDQVRRTRDKLQDKGLLRFHQLSPRAVYYASWRIDQEAFALCLGKIKLRNALRKETQSRVDSYAAKLKLVYEQQREKDEHRKLDEEKKKLENQREKREAAARQTPFNYVQIPGVATPTEVRVANSQRIEFANGQVAHAKEIWMANFGEILTNLSESHIALSYQGTEYLIERHKLNLFFPSR